MDANNSKNAMSSSKDVGATTTTAAASSDSAHPRRRILQNFVLIWMDAKIDESNQECQNTLSQLRNVANDVNIFTQRNKCIDFLTDVKSQKAFMIIEGDLCQKILPLINDIPQIDSIYILCRNISTHEQWTKEWAKVKGTHTEITSICESLQQAVRQSNQDSIAISFIGKDEGGSYDDLNRLEPSFMYTQIFKEILLEMTHSEQSVKKFAVYCRDGNYGSSSNITRFENEYNANLAIWWYAYPSFIYSTLNTALRMLEADIIINMGFFIRDLHRQIEGLHREQISNLREKPFTVYRGQGLSATAFEKLRKTEGGLISFNNFLSTSRKREVSLSFAETASTNPDMVGILFQMSINPSVSSIPFAAIREVSYFKNEEEILFSMHSVFRVGKTRQIDSDKPLYQVELALTADNDQQLHILTKHIRNETRNGTGWDRLSILLMKIGHFDKAEDLCNVLLEQTTNEDARAIYYNNLGCVTDAQGDYEKAIWYYEKALEIRQKTLPPNHPDLPRSYNNIGGVYDHMGDYSKALSFHEKALEIGQKTLLPNHPVLAESYNNIAAVYCNIGEYPKALSFLEKTLEIWEKTLPPNHPSLATSYNNIGLMYEKMGEYSKTLSFYEKALEIWEKTLPPNHPDLAESYNNIAGVYCNIGEYSKALSFYAKALEIFEKILPLNHPSSAISYNNIGSVYYKMGEYLKALSFHESALKIFAETSSFKSSSFGSNLQQYCFGVLQHGRVSKSTFIS